MALAVGVVYLGDHLTQRTVTVMAPKDADRVEDVTEHAGLQQRGNAATWWRYVVFGEEGVNALAQRVAG